MKYLIGLLCLFSVAQAQFAPTSAKSKFVNGIGIGSKDTSQFTAADTIALTIARDSVMYYRYRGFWRPIATGGNLSAYKLISDTLFANGYTTRARLKQGLDSLAATKVNISDTASMLAPYFRDSDTTGLLNQVVRTFGAQTVFGIKAFGDSMRIGAGLSVLRIQADAGISLSQELNIRKNTNSLSTDFLKIGTSVGSGILYGSYIKSTSNHLSFTGNDMVLGVTNTSGNNVDAISISSAGVTSINSLSTAGIVTNTSAGVLGTTSIVPIANGGTGSSTQNFVDLTTSQTITGQKTFNVSGNSGNVIINHGSGSGVALNITKGGNGEGLIVNKTSGSGNAATITGTLEATTLVKNGGTSSQFLKADGSVDNNTYTTTSQNALKLNISDTAAMLLPYTRVQRFTDSLTNVQSRIQTKQNILTLTTTGTSGAATLVGSTLNIPQYQSVLTNPVTGTGTTNYLPKFTGASTIGNSQIFDNGTNVGIGTNLSSAFTLDVLGAVPLRVVSNSNASTPTYGASQIFRQSNTVGNGVGIALGMWNSSNANTETAYLGTIITTNTAGAERGDLVFYTTNNGSVRNEGFRLNSSSNLLLGTTTDNGARLQVSGSVSANSYNVGGNGTLSNSGFWGTLITAGAGSYADFGLVNSATTVIMHNPTGTTNMVFNGTVTATNGTFTNGVNSTSNVTIGSGGGFGVSNSTTLTLNTPNGGGQIAPAFIDYKSNGTTVWKAGITSTNNGQVFYRISDATSDILTISSTGAATFSGNVGIGQTASASFGLAVSSALPSIFTVTSSANSATYGGSIFYRGINTVGNGNGLAFNMNNSSSNSSEYVYIGGIIEGNTAGAENGAFIVAPTVSGARVERFRIASTGAATFSSTLGINGVADNVKGGQYTATVSDRINFSGVTSVFPTFTRVGNVVVAQGAIQINPTTANTYTEFRINLPSGWGDAGTQPYCGSGTLVDGGSTTTNNDSYRPVSVSIIGNVAYISFYPRTTSTASISFSFQYILP